MQLPTIHPNGTRKEQLIENLRKAICDLNLAYDSLKQCAPNERDYPQGPEAMERAKKQYLDWMLWIAELEAELEEFTLAIDQM